MKPIPVRSVDEARDVWTASDWAVYDFARTEEHDGEPGWMLVNMDTGRQLRISGESDSISREDDLRHEINEVLDQHGVDYTTTR